jgi:O-antigen/teichoic acid export membrane protein
VTVLLIAALALPVGVLLPHVLVPVFGAGFENALATTYVLLAAAVLGIPGLILGAGLAAWNRPELGAYAALAALAVSAAGLVVLTPSGGAAGAATAILVSSAVSSAVAAVFFSRITGLSVAAIVPPRISDARLLVSEVAGVWLRVRSRVRR